MYEDLLDFYDRKREKWTFEDFLKSSGAMDIIVPKDEEEKKEVKTDSKEEKSPTKMEYRRSNYRKLTKEEKTKR